MSTDAEVLMDGRSKNIIHSTTKFMAASSLIRATKLTAPTTILMKTEDSRFRTNSVLSLEIVGVSANLHWGLLFATNSMPSISTSFSAIP
jgi:hypothetical protein